MKNVNEEKEILIKKVFLKPVNQLCKNIINIWKTFVCQIKVMRYVTNIQKKIA